MTNILKDIQNFFGLVNQKLSALNYLKDLRDEIKLYAIYKS